MPGEARAAGLVVHPREGVIAVARPKIVAVEKSVWVQDGIILAAVPKSQSKYDLED